MAYVNMTIDGQTRRTEQLVLNGSKTAVLQAVLEASDTAGSGNTMETGKFTPSGRAQNVSIPVSSKKNYFSMFPTNYSDVDTTTGMAFTTMMFDNGEKCISSYSNGSGTTVDAGGQVSPSGATGVFNSWTVVEYKDTTIEVGMGSATGDSQDSNRRALQAGLEYTWIAW